MYMNQELQDKLFSKYPKIFKDLEYIECGDGWYTIIDTLCHSIQGHLNQEEMERIYNTEHNERVQAALDGNLQPLRDFFYHQSNPDRWAVCSMKEGFVEVKDPIEQVVVRQVKEKFGGLRFYTEGGDEYIQGMIYMAEHLSISTCEVCGKPGRRGRKGSQIVTLCEEHAKEK